MQAALIVLLAFALLLMPFEVALAGPVSNSYELKQYGFGSGGMEGGTSTNYSLFGILGEVDAGNASSNGYKTLNGLTYTLLANQPAPPTFTNPGSNYDRLKFILDTGNNPTDAVFSIVLSDDNFVTTYYVQNDNTISTTLGAEDWQTYANWGGATGEYVTRLKAGTTYKMKVKARHGNYTESAYSGEATQATVTPSLTFGISANTVTFSNLNSANTYTDDTKSTTLTTSTNAYNGYIIYGRETQPLTHVTAGSTIPDYLDPNSAPTNWTGVGFGYTTTDTNLSGGTANRFASATKYAGFTTATPGDPVADHTDIVETTPVSGEQFTVSYRVTATETTRSGQYQSTISYVVVPAY